MPADEALRRFSRQFPDLAAAAASLPTNPLPASYEVQLRPELARDPAVDRLAAQLRQQAGVSDVRYDRRWIERLLAFVGAARAAGLVLVAVLTLAACLTITGVVRLALHARRAEIEIMQLVGAPLAYIRGPFVLEGTLLGLTGAVVALGAAGRGVSVRARAPGRRGGGTGGGGRRPVPAGRPDAGAGRRRRAPSAAWADYWPPARPGKR